MGFYTKLQWTIESFKKKKQKIIKGKKKQRALLNSEGLIKQPILLREQGFGSLPQSSRAGWEWNDESL